MKAIEVVVNCGDVSYRVLVGGGDRVCVLQHKSRNLMVAFEEERLHRDREVQEVSHC